MKRALSFIAATVVATSVYSQPYTGSAAANDALMEQARQRIYEAAPQSNSGAPASSQLDSSPGFERAAGSSNSSTGQSNGANLSGGYSTSSGNGAAVTRDSDISGLENPQTSGGREGSVQSDSIERPADEQRTGQGNVGAPGRSESGASSSDALSRDANETDFLGALNTPDLEGDYIRSLDENSDTKVYNGTDYWKQEGVGAPASAQSGAVSSDGKEMKKDCDSDKARKSQTWNDRNQSDDSAVRSSGTAVESDERYRINREQGDSESQYHVNREAGSPGNSEASGNAAVSESGTRSSGTAVDSDERARRERENRSSAESEKSGATPSSGTAADSDGKAHPDL